MARDVLEHHDRVVDNEADGYGEGHQREIVEAVARDPHEGAGAQERQRHRDAGNDRRPEAAQKDEDHHHHEHDGEGKRDLDVVNGSANGGGSIGENADVYGRRDRSLQRLQSAFDRLDGGDDVRAGNLEHHEKDARLAVAPGGLGRVLRPRDRLTNVAHAHRRPIAISDDDVVPVLGLGQLVVGLDGEGLLGTDQRAFGAVDGRDADLRAHVLELQPLFDQFGGIDLDPYGRGLLAADPHEGDARDLAQVLGEDIFGGVVDVDHWRDVRLNGQDEDRRVGGVDLAIGRRTGQILRQLPGGGVDRSLDVVGGGVDIAVEIELDGDRRHAERARRRHLRDARNLRDLAFERLGDRGRHRIRRSARQRSRDRDGWKVDLRQGRDRQRREGDQPDQKHRDHDERGRDRAMDEGGGEALVHRPRFRSPCRSRRSTRAEAGTDRSSPRGRLPSGHRK